ncbi:MAG: hypothetical protein HUJ27_04875 [Rhodobacteraceae bacterium]|nr:hypothetical protein [Paracoccaceae bacterium]
MPLISVSHLGRKLEVMYVLSCLRDLWKDMGLTVSVGDSFEKQADLCILHQNQTRLDKSQLPSAPAGTRVLNGEVLDISKRRYSSLMLGRDDPWGGAVIVKSNLNYFGEPEKRQKAKPLQ